VREQHALFARELTRCHVESELKATVASVMVLMGGEWGPSRTVVKCHQTLLQIRDKNWHTECR
jgi:hypothetical protein